jgi:acyl-CoA synthetase (AMP-forming)/AMP-acid ligase II
MHTRTEQEWADLRAKLRTASDDDLGMLLENAGEIIAEARAGFYSGGPGSPMDPHEPTTRWALAVEAEASRRREARVS